MQLNPAGMIRRPSIYAGAGIRCGRTCRPQAGAWFPGRGQCARAAGQNASLMLNMNPLVCFPNP